MGAWLRLFRFSGVFTILSNAVAAWTVAVFLDSRTYQPGLEVLGKTLYIQGTNAWWILLSGMLLYLAGMVFNDVADAERDQRIAPDRPIPSGKVGLGAAAAAGLVLSVCALLASSMAGTRAGLMAGVVLSLILLYDFGLKQLPWLGSLVMGLIRSAHALFALLALGSHPGCYFDRSWEPLLRSVGLLLGPEPWSILLYPGLLGLYIFGLTLASELEHRSSRRVELVIAGLLVLGSQALALFLVLRAGWMRDLLTQDRRWFLVLWGGTYLVLALFQAWRWFRSWRTALLGGRRDLAGPLTRLGLTGITPLDALLAGAFHPLIGLLVLLLVGPQALLRPRARMD